MSESVHLEKWPKADKKLIDKKLEAKMVSARKICELGHSLRKLAKIKVDQPLAELKIEGKDPGTEFNSLIKDELNVKEISLVEKLPEQKNEWLIVEQGEIKLALNTRV